MPIKPQYAQQNAWDAEHTTRITLKLNNRTDADILAYLARQDSKQGRIKELIREDIAREVR